MRNQSDGIINLLKASPVFGGITESVLEEIVPLFEEYDCRTEETLYEKGDLTDGFYLIFDGEAVVVKKNRTHHTELLSLSKGDYCGEEAMYYSPRRNATVIIKQPSTVLLLENHNVPQVLSLCPQIRENLKILIQSRDLIQKLPFSWLGSDETIEVITRKHPALLIGSITPPVIFFACILIFIFLLMEFLGASTTTGLIILAIAFPISMIWLMWNIFNWSNDYYILTNKRMVWIERVAGVYDSRQEAPLSTLLSVGTRKSRLGNLLGYADVTVRTFVGTISFKKIGNAAIIAKMIESHWSSSKEVDLEEESEAMRIALRAKFALESDQPEPDGMPESMVDLDKTEAESVRETSFFEWLFSDFLKVRFEVGGTITYRKHWLILLRRTWIPILLMVAGFVFGGAVLVNKFAYLPKSALLVVTVIYFVIILVWLSYQYADWRNDIYQLTHDQVIDVDRKPLGKENRRTAPLESILSIEFERKGLLGIVFNFGTVTITVGNSKLTFNNVYNPSEVQQDIFARMGIRQEEKRQLAIDQERERVSEWLKVYHDQAEEMQSKKEVDIPGQDE
ncbi:MAG: cyclic nucleotide-binding domain-containing protein [Anaerolineaceae bacterium]|nr:cyclic nucleotide-binding domain-containing protein [Anaerolineaceae bacterium]